MLLPVSMATRGILFICLVDDEGTQGGDPFYNLEPLLEETREWALLVARLPRGPKESAAVSVPPFFTWL